MAIRNGVRHGSSSMAITDHTARDQAWAPASVEWVAARPPPPTHARRQPWARGLLPAASSVLFRPLTPPYWPPGAARAHTRDQRAQATPSLTGRRLAGNRWSERAHRGSDTRQRH